MNGTYQLIPAGHKLERVMISQLASIGILGQGMIALIKKSPLFPCVLTFLSTTIFRSTFFRMKWYCMLMCFVCAWNPRFLDMNIALYLSHTIFTLLCVKPCSLHNMCTQIISLVAWVRTIYSASIVDKAIVLYLLLIQLVAPPNKETTLPLIDLLLSMSPP